MRQLKQLRKSAFQYQPSPNSGLISAEIESPEFDTRSLFTSLHVQNGQTVVLGGLVKERDQKDRSGIPFLSRIPIIGLLFGRRSTTTERRHLLIFVTARLIEPSGAQISDDIRTMRDTARVVLPAEYRGDADKKAPPTSAVEPGAGSSQPRVAASVNPWEKGRGR